MKTNDKPMVKPIKAKQSGKVIGMVITDCPLCRNTISFDVQSAKFCPYCNAEVSVDLDHVEVSVRATKTVAAKGAPKRVS
ncbi:MAG: hypothetical protein QHI48_08665 [Bacteroidota bacterium]|nr:hypothetical protein [Bacteroidota bacterium]